MTAADEQQKEYTTLLPVHMESLIDIEKSVKTQQRLVRMKWLTYMEESESVEPQGRPKRQK